MIRCHFGLWKIVMDEVINHENNQQINETNLKDAALLCTWLHWFIMSSSMTKSAFHNSCQFVYFRSLT